MKRVSFLIILFISFAFVSCRNKTVVLLTKKWDCIQVDNILPPGGMFLSAEDSVNTMLLEAALQKLSWTFKNNMRYECTVDNSTVVQGKYQLKDNDKIIVLTPESKTFSNWYIINSISEYELVISGKAENKNLVLHFKAD